MKLRALLSMRREKRILQHPGLQPLWDSLERERVQQQVAAVVLILAGLAAIVVGVVGRQLWTPLIGGLLASGALYWLFRLLSEQPLAALRRQLHDEPEDIAWVYGTETKRMPFGFRTQSAGTLYFVQHDGTGDSYNIAPKHLKMVTKTLNRVLPHAEFGYTEERDLKYRGEVTRMRGRRMQDLWGEEQSK